MRWLLVPVLLFLPLLALACGDDDTAMTRTDTPGPATGGQEPIEPLSEIEEIPAFLGYLFDPASDSHLIFSADPNIDVEAVKEAILERDPALAGQFGGKDFRVVHARCDAGLTACYRLLQTLLLTFLPAELKKDWEFSEEDGNEIVFGFSSEEALAWAQERVSRIEAPPGMITLVFQEPGMDD